MPQEQCTPALLSARGTAWLAPINQQKDRRRAGYTGHFQHAAAADKMACALPENPGRMPRPSLSVLSDLTPVRFLKSSLSDYLM